MSYRVVFTDTAREDLRSIAYSIADLSGNKELALRFVGELRAHTEILKTFPESGNLPKDRVLRGAEYRFLVYKEYLLFYSVDKERETVFILAVFHEKQDYMRVMRRFI